MRITNFDVVGLGSNYPVEVLVKPVFSHESSGILASANTYRGVDGTNFVQIRKQGDIVGMFVFQNDEHESKKYLSNLPEFWFNSQVLWDSRPYKESK